MTKDFLYRFISKHKLTVLATVSGDNIPQTALVGFAITPDLEIIFDTVTTSRKYKNLLRNPAISFVIGWDSEQTVQYEGTAKIPTDTELEKLSPYYFKAFPDGINRKENWKDLVYFYVKPKWIRYSDFDTNTIEEIEL
ncbi:pyridoxamine 5'-phosphate oxidase family protein [Danxiaibacter flavus]|uniref:Pyridoxamine 5'-phosphate oxidase family protein n=1 Tax=Danxiaibacter flavus TaxID=3049108 RepID=A0ABV3ZM36_9BACT|nr:pyridoxamine 5'-phosphate oxidase family protein [Chitinophagaceae bacterium DXS]